MEPARSLLAAVLALAMSAPAALAADGRGSTDGPTVVELFTSQGCYSCPPAEAFLTELARQGGVIALEFHVDYWNDLVHGGAGRWKDVFSKHAYTQRQVGYNQRIRGRRNVYTPQMVIDGRLEAVGSRRLAVLDRVRTAEAERSGRVAIDVALDGGKGATLHLAGPVKQPAAVWLVRFLEERRTEVRAGENKGKSLLSRNIVTELRRVGDWRGSETTIPVPGFALADGEGCAVLVQDATLGPILGAAYCRPPTG